MPILIEPAKENESSEEQGKSKKRIRKKRGVSSVFRYRRDAKSQTIDIWVDQGDASIDDVAELFAALSDLDRAFGGNGLDFFVDKTDQRVYEGGA